MFRRQRSSGGCDSTSRPPPSRPRPRSQSDARDGRSIPEFSRPVQALQTTDKHKVTAPEGWKLGGEVIVPPPGSVCKTPRSA
jgi:alkyl hydroperoxide reductase subunit AhpC